MSRPGKASVLALVAKHGGTIEDNSDRRTHAWMADAPAGKVWAANGCHAYGAWVYKYTGGTDGMWSDLHEALSMGVEDCEDDDCEYCHPVPEEEMGR